VESLTKHWKLAALIISSTFVYCWFGYFLDRSNFSEVVIGFSLCFAAYAYFIRYKKVKSLGFYLFLGILFRLLFLLSVPTLSDDYFRFIWDGQLSLNGLNPFDALPTEVLAEFPNKQALLNGMNSPNYFTVYPPVAQFIYFVCAWLSPNSIYGSVIVLRVLIFLCELGTLLLLPKLLSSLKLDPNKALLYALNPLVIVELTGNLHFEGFMIFFLLLAVFLLVQQKNSLSALAWGLAAAVKLLPLLLLPIFIRKLKVGQALLFYLLVGFVFLALWLPFYSSTMIEHLQQSVNLYHATFEFNASIYYLIRWLGFELVGYNVIGIVGAWLSKIAIVLMVLLFIRRSNNVWPNFFNSLLLGMAVYYFLALIIHPWYLCTLVFLSVFTQYRFAIVWSGMVILSYFSYSNADFQENYWLIAAEYCLVFFILVKDLKRNSLNLTTAT